MWPLCHTEPCSFLLTLVSPWPMGLGNIDLDCWHLILPDGYCMHFIGLRHNYTQPHSQQLLAQLYESGDLHCFKLRLFVDVLLLQARDGTLGII